jgi:hypothetical protein
MTLVWQTSGDDQSRKNKLFKQMPYQITEKAHSAAYLKIKKIVDLFILNKALDNKVGT